MKNLKNVKVLDKKAQQNVKGGAIHCPPGTYRCDHRTCVPADQPYLCP